MSGEALAKKVGYKNQSAIGNLENRAGGTGGNKISKIADALNVSVDWLLNGPDSDNVPFLPPKIPLADSSQHGRSTVASEPIPDTDAGHDPLFKEAIGLLKAMSKRGLLEAIPYLQFLTKQHPAASHQEDGERDPVPRPKAA